jgi:hypothetical protein
MITKHNSICYLRQTSTYLPTTSLYRSMVTKKIYAISDYISQKYTVNVI